MKCEKIKAEFSEYLTGEMDDKTRGEFQKHVTTCGSCRKELENLSVIWTKLGVLPDEQPSSNLRKRFYAVLEHYQQRLGQKKARSGSEEKLESRGFGYWMPKKYALQLVFALMLLFIGLTAGYFLQGNLIRGEDLAQIRQEVVQLRQMTAVALLRQESLTEQLRGVGLTPRAEQLDRETLDALLRLIGNETARELRLDTPGMPYPFPGYPVIDQEFVRSLSEQASPLVEVTLSLIGQVERF